MESCDFLGIERPLLKEEDLLTEVTAVKNEIGKKYFMLNNLERRLDKKLTKRKVIKIKLFYDEEGTSPYLLSKKEEYQKLGQEIDQRILELEKELKEEKELGYDIKEHTIEGPDLRPWPMIHFNLVAVEEYDKESKHHKHKGYKRYKRLIQK